MRSGTINRDLKTDKMLTANDRDGQGDDEVIQLDIVEDSNYYASNGELFCIQGNNRAQSPVRNNRKKISDVRKVDNIKEYYNISNDQTDMLGNGAFAVVRLGTKVPDTQGTDSSKKLKHNATHISPTMRHMESKYAIKMMRKSYIDVNKIYKSLLHNEM